MATHLISAVLIVKNEEAHLPACLAALQHVVDEIVIADTGSTDATVQLAKSAAARVVHIPWTNDFAAARNAAIAHAQTPWILSIDADECVQGGATANAALRHFIDTHTPNTVGTTEIHNVDNGTGLIDETVDHTERFFHREHFQFQGAIHEQLAPRTGTKARATTGIRLIHTGYAHAPEDPAHKSLRNLPLLRAALENAPDDEYLHFQLGKAHFALKQYAPAADAFLAALARMHFSGTALPTGCQCTIARPIVTACLANTAYALANLNRIPEALALLNKHRALAHPGTQSADFHHVLGYLHLMQGDVPRSRAAYNASLALGPPHEDVLGTGTFSSHYHLGLLDEAEQKIPDATAHYSASLASRPDYRPTISRAIDWLLEGHATQGNQLLHQAAPNTTKNLYLERLERSLQNGNPGELQKLLAAATTTPEPLRNAATAWANNKKR